MAEALSIPAILADPLVQTGLLSLFGALTTHAALRHRPALRLVGQIILFAVLTLLLFWHGIVPYEGGPAQTSTLQSVFLGLAKIVWWVNAALTLVGCVRVFLIFERQPREGRLIQDLVIGMIYVGVALSVFANVFSFPVGTIIATSGVFAVIFGLAMQSTLSDLFSGIALNIGRPYGIGDWITLGNGIEGKVLETNWRATHLLSGTGDLIVLPNSTLAKANLTNLSRPDHSHGVKLPVRIAPTKSPRIIADVMRAALLNSGSVLPRPQPSVHVKSLDAEALELELSFHVRDYATASAVKDEVFDLVARHVRAAGLLLASPTGRAPEFDMEAAREPHRPTPLRLLDAIPLFASLTEDEKETLAATMLRRTYRAGETVMAQGAIVTALTVLRSGVLVVSRSEGGQDNEVRRLAPGDFFGETGLLTGSGEPGSIRALTFAVVYEIGAAGLAPLMRDRPAIAEELGSVLAQRATVVHGEAKVPITATVDHGSVARLAALIRAYIHPSSPHE